MPSNDCGKNLFCKTPLIESLPLSKHCPNRVYLKLENCHLSGSFKFRGISRACQQVSELEPKLKLTRADTNVSIDRHLKKDVKKLFPRRVATQVWPLRRALDYWDLNVEYLFRSPRLQK